MMGILAWIVFGGLAGWVASLLMGTRQGCIMDVIVGIIGAFLGGAIFSMLTGAGFTGWNWWSFFVAVIGAIVFIAIVRALRGGPREPVD